MIKRLARLGETKVDGTIHEHGLVLAEPFIRVAELLTKRMLYPVDREHDHGPDAVPYTSIADTFQVRAATIVVVQKVEFQGQVNVVEGLVHQRRGGR